MLLNDVGQGCLQRFAAPRAFNPHDALRNKCAAAVRLMQAPEMPLLRRESKAIGDC
nr:hypothetical protein [uncultured bacterium]